jgi:TatA/E family protein of Tat protein translocase
MHLLVIFGIALLVFGPKKLPELGKGIGEGIRSFKSAMKAEEELAAADLRQFMIARQPVFTAPER